jgi:hypothetical protein
MFGMSAKVYQAISAVMADLAVDGIGKDRKNEQQGYKFRGIDDVYNALSSTLAKNGLLMLPRVLSREVVERVSAKGSVLFYVTVEAEFDLVASEDGSTHTIKTYGEAMDSGDKATNKAMSAAYKYAAMQAFCIPTEGDNDADATTHAVKPMVPNTSVHPEGPDWYKTEGAGMSAAKAKAEGLGEKVNQWLGDLETIPTVAALRDWADQNGDTIRTMPKGWRIEVREAFDRRGRELGAM